MGFPDGLFVLGRSKVYGTHFPRELNQGVRIGRVAAMTTEPLKTANSPHPKRAVSSCVLVWLG